MSESLKCRVRRITSTGNVSSWGHQLPCTTKHLLIFLIYRVDVLLGNAISRILSQGDSKVEGDINIVCRGPKIVIRSLFIYDDWCPKTRTPTGSTLNLLIILGAILPIYEKTYMLPTDMLPTYGFLSRGSMTSWHGNAVSFITGLCARNLLASSRFCSQRSIMRSFDICFWW